MVEQQRDSDQHCYIKMLCGMQDRFRASVTQEYILAVDEAHPQHADQESEHMMAGQESKVTCMLAINDSAVQAVQKLGIQKLLAQCRFFIYENTAGLRGA